MKKSWLALLISLWIPVCAVIASAAESAPAQLTLGILPGGNPENLRVQAVELAKDLQGRLEIPVNVYISKDYDGLIQAMKEKKVDFAFFSALTYVFAEKEVKTKVLLKKVWDEPYYYSAIVTPWKSKIKKLAQLKGKRIAFVDEKSASGYLYPLVELHKKDIHRKDFKDVIFSGNHQASVRLMEDGKVDAAAVFSDDPKGNKGAWRKFASNPKARYRVLWMSEPIPNDPFCVRQEFYDEFPKTTHTLMFALIDIVNGEKGARYAELLGPRDLMPATSKQYDPVREMAQALHLEKP